jgi:hypothetical protein
MPVAPLRTRVLDIARSQIGVRETPGTPNQGPEIDSYRASVTNSPGHWDQPWCATFASWVFNEAHAPLVDHDGDDWSARIGDWAKHSDRFRAPGTAMHPGDLVLLHKQNGADRWANHVGIIEHVHRNGSIETIEGNVDDMVKRVSHPTTDPIVGYVDITGLDTPEGR